MSNTPNFTALEYSIFKHASDTGRYVTGETGLDWPVISSFVARGFLKDHGAQILAGGDHYLTPTSKGREWFGEILGNHHRYPERKPPTKRQRRARDRMDRFYAFQDAYGGTFKQFLTFIKNNRQFA